MRNSCERVPENRIRAFKASLLHLLPRECKGSFPFSERIKLLLRAWRGYYFYYITEGSVLCAYTFLKRNYFGKYAFMGKKDLLINPYYVAPGYRGKGLGTQMLCAVLSQLPEKHGDIWAVVKDDNISSIRALKKAGFQQIGFSSKNGWSHRLSKAETNLIIFCYKG
ncbi:MAG: GNAT family N-acetyltransferase [Firmicutes bacterium]|nr:GNAT family N-acetyltransferase [Bacillota bacterium]